MNGFNLYHKNNIIGTLGGSIQSFELTYANTKTGSVTASGYVTTGSQTCRVYNVENFKSIQLDVKWGFNIASYAAFYENEDNLINPLLVFQIHEMSSEYKRIVEVPENAKVIVISYTQLTNPPMIYKIYGTPYEFFLNNLSVNNDITATDNYLKLRMDLKDTICNENLFPDPHLTNNTLIERIATTYTDNMANITLNTLLALAQQSNGKWSDDGTYANIEEDEIIGKCIKLKCTPNNFGANVPKLGLSRHKLEELGFEEGDIIRFGAYMRCTGDLVQNTFGLTVCPADNKPHWVEFFNKPFSKDTNPVYGFVLKHDNQTNEEYVFGKFCLKNETKGYYVGFEEASTNSDNSTGGFSNPFNGKNFVSICDSLGIIFPNSWQSQICKMLGMVFKGNITQGGTLSLSIDDNCGQARCLQLTEDTNPEVIIYENINDHGCADYGGSIEDEAFMLSQFIDYPTGKASQTSAIAYFKENLNTILGTPKSGTMYRLGYTTNMVKFDVKKAPTSSGTVYVIVNGKQYGINVSPANTILSLMQSIRNYKYDGLALQGHDNISYCLFTGETDSTPECSFNSNGTGCQVEVSVTQNDNGKIGICFYGHDPSKWGNVDNWKLIPQISYYSICKGILEYFSTKFPKAWVFWWCPEAYQMPWSNMTTYARPDGSFDIDKYKKSAENRYERIMKIVKEVCDYYGYPVLDTLTKGGMNIHNGSTYFSASNVHMNSMAEGNKRLAEAMFMQMI